MDKRVAMYTAYMNTDTILNFSFYTSLFNDVIYRFIEWHPCIVEPIMETIIIHTTQIACTD